MIEQSSITIVGLGPGDPESRTLGAQRALDSADRIILRTRVHPGVDDLTSDSRVSDCDDLYEAAERFDRLYQDVADRVLAAARMPGRVVFAVPGHPRFGERSVPLIESGASADGIPVRVMDSVSFVDAVAGTLGCDPVADGLQIADAERFAAALDRDPFAAGMLGVDPAWPLLVGQIYNPELAAAVKIALGRMYPDAHPVTIIRGAGLPAAAPAQTVELHELDRQAVDHLTSVWVSPMPPLEATRSPESLTRIVARLRRPDGCPWDREQDHRSLRASVLEEAYEVVDAIDDEDDAGLAEELGDLLLLVAMQAQIAEEHGTFRIEDVYEGIVRKLIRRHPHVFGDAQADTPEAVIVTWDSVKAAEREARGNAPIEPDVVGSLPRSMPVTRKIVEVMAPRTVLGAPTSPATGEAALTAISDIIALGIDPERALEVSLRRTTTRNDNYEREVEPAARSTRSGGSPG